MHKGCAIVILAAAMQSVACAALFTEDFEGFEGLGFSPAPASGMLDSGRWRVNGLSDGDGAFGSVHVNGDFARGRSAGRVSRGGVYAFDVGGADTGLDTALGFQATGSDLTPGAILLAINPGPDASALTVAYDLYVFNDGDRASAVHFAAGPADTPLGSLPAFDFETPGARDAQPVWGRKSLSALVPASAFLPGEPLWLRWGFDDAGGAGARDELAIDNVRVERATVSALAPEPGAAALLSIGLTLLAWMRRRTLLPGTKPAGSQEAAAHV